MMDCVWVLKKSKKKKKLICFVLCFAFFFCLFAFATKVLFAHSTVIGFFDVAVHICRAKKTTPETDR